jgi:hypothetical protein
MGARRYVNAARTVRVSARRARSRRPPQAGVAILGAPGSGRSCPIRSLASHQANGSGRRLLARLALTRPRVREKTLKNFPRSMHLLALSDRPNPKLSPRSRSATGSEGDG